jgi:hypothetical protein
MNFNGQFFIGQNPVFAGDVTFEGDVIVGGTLKLADGNLSAPSLAFVSDPTLGLYKSGTGTISFAQGGTLISSFSVALIKHYTNTQIIDGSVTTPSLAFTSDPTVGLYKSSTGGMGIASGGVYLMRISPTQAIIAPPAFFSSLSAANITATTSMTTPTISGTSSSFNAYQAGDGSLSIPSYTFASDTSIGLYKPGIGQLGIASEVASIATFSPVLSTISTPLTVTMPTTLSSLTTTGASTMASLNVTGTTTLASLTVTGTTSIPSLTISGTATVGQIVTTAQPFVRWSNSTINYPKNSTTHVVFNSKDEDIGGGSSVIPYDTSANLFTATVGGFYSVDVLQISNFTASNDGYRAMSISSATNIYFGTSASTNATTWAGAGSTFVALHQEGWLNANDTFYIQASPTGNAGNVGTYTQISIKKTG